LKKVYILAWSSNPNTDYLTCLFKQSSLLLKQIL
jgi:hypothetical protein